MASVAGEGRYRHPVRLPALLPIRKCSAATLTVPRDLIGDSDFCMTYGDGVVSIDITALLAFHRAHGRLATVTAVRPPGRFGALEITDDRVSAFIEKPSGENGYINGGFFVLSPKVLDYIEGDETVWPMQALARAGQLAFRHNGFWQPMDTLRPCCRTQRSRRCAAGSCHPHGRPGPRCGRPTAIRRRPTPSTSWVGAPARCGASHRQRAGDRQGHQRQMLREPRVALGLSRGGVVGRLRSVQLLEGLPGTRSSYMAAVLFRWRKRSCACLGAGRQRHRRRLGGGPHRSRLRARVLRRQAVGPAQPRRSSRLAARAGSALRLSPVGRTPVRRRRRLRRRLELRAIRGQHAAGWLYRGEARPPLDAATWRMADGKQPHGAVHLKIDASKAQVRLGWHPRLATDLALDWTAA